MYAEGRGHSLRTQVGKVASENSKVQGVKCQDKRRFEKRAVGAATGALAETGQLDDKHDDADDAHVQAEDKDDKEPPVDLARDAAREWLLERTLDDGRVEEGEDTPDVQEAPIRQTVRNDGRDQDKTNQGDPAVKIH